VDLDPMDRKREGRWSSPARQNSGEDAQEVDGELIPVVSDGEEVVDAMRTATAVSNPWSMTTCASRGKDKRRLETTAGSVIFSGAFL
jgi:hypothetical protein